MISLGGVISSNRNIMALDGLAHLYGSKDMVQRLGYIFFPQRWPFLRWTAWNKARRSGIVQRIYMGPMVHVGPESYMDAETTLEDGQSYLDKTLEVVSELLKQFETSERSRVETT